MKRIKKHNHRTDLNFQCGMPKQRARGRTLTPLQMCGTSTIGQWPQWCAMAVYVKSMQLGHGSFGHWFNVKDRDRKMTRREWTNQSNAQKNTCGKKWLLITVIVFPQWDQKDFSGLSGSMKNKKRTNNGHVRNHRRLKSKPRVGNLGIAIDTVTLRVLTAQTALARRLSSDASLACCSWGRAGSRNLALCGGADRPPKSSELWILCNPTIAMRLNHPALSVTITTWN